MTESEQLPYFVREVLGCQCADSVLANIRVCSEPDQVAGIPLTLCIDVDGRLLVYVVCTEAPTALIDLLQSVFDAGRKARDLNGFNRFRFVVGTASAGKETEPLLGAFYTLVGLDDRQHLH